MIRAKKHDPAATRQNEIFGKKIGLMATIFGCRHKNLSRPFTHDSGSYRVCPSCGVRRSFDADTLTNAGVFLLPAAAELNFNRD